MKCVSVTLALITALLQTASSVTAINLRGGGDYCQITSWHDILAEQMKEQGSFPHKSWVDGIPPPRHSGREPPIKLDVSINNVVVTKANNHAAGDGWEKLLGAQVLRAQVLREKVLREPQQTLMPSPPTACRTPRRPPPMDLDTTRNSVVQQEPNTCELTAIEQFAQRLSPEERIALAGHIYALHNPREAETDEKQLAMRAHSPVGKIRDSLKKRLSLSPTLRVRKLFKRGSDENRVEIRVG